jgi:hypothetical protein
LCDFGGVSTNRTLEAPQKDQVAPALPTVFAKGHGELGG